MKETVIPKSNIDKKTNYYDLRSYYTVAHGTYYRSPMCKTLCKNESGYFDKLDKDILFRIGQLILNPKVVTNYYKKWKHDNDFDGTGVYIRVVRSPIYNSKVRKHLSMTIWGHYVHEINATFEIDDSESGYPEDLNGKACVELTDDGLEGLRVYKGKEYVFFVNTKMMEQFADVKTEDEYYDLLNKCTAESRFSGMGIF